MQHVCETFAVKRLHIWSDGAAQHFKNYKTMSLFSHYLKEFDLQYVDWNFQVSLQRSYEILSITLR
jgi:hypothetical protein